MNIEPINECELINEPLITNVVVKEEVMTKETLTNELLAKETPIDDNHIDMAKDKENEAKTESQAPIGFRKKSPSDWSVSDVAEFLDSVGFATESGLFRDQEIDGRSLLLLKRDDVISGLNLKLGPALKIYSLINHLQYR